MVEMLKDTKDMEIFAIAGIGAYTGAVVNKFIPAFVGNYTTIAVGILEFIGAVFLIKYNKSIGIFVGGAAVFSFLDGVFRIAAPQYAE